MKNKYLSLIIAGLLFFLAGYKAEAQGLAAVKNEIAKDNALYFDLFKKKSAAIVDLYTNDGCLLSPDAPAICGKAALTKDFTDTYAAGQVSGVKFTTMEIYGDGKDFVTEEGTWQVFDPKGKMIGYGKYLKLWRKTKAGWKIFRDLFNSDRKS